MEERLIEKLAQSVGGRERLAGFFTNRTFGDLHKRAESELASGAATIIDAVERTEKAIKAAGLRDYWPGPEALERILIRSWAMYQHAGSRTLNWMITGRSKFPVARNEKRMDTEYKRLGEYLDIAAKAPERAIRRARAAMKAQLGAGGCAELELADLRKRLEDREKLQAHMKGVNAVIRKHKLRGFDDAERLVELAREAGFHMVRSLAQQLLTPDWGPAGYASYQLSNNNAEIHRLRDRVAQVEAKLARIENAPEEAPEREVAGVRVIEDLADDRLRLMFPGKPAPDVIQLLKSRGFRWSPSNGAWQRQLTQNARWAAEAVLKQLKPEPQRLTPIRRDWGAAA